VRRNGHKEEEVGIRDERKEGQGLGKEEIR
jgi:hypothetical protein